MNPSKQEIEAILDKAQLAFVETKAKAIDERLTLMHAVADEIEALGPELIAVAGEESNLPEGRLVGEKARTVFQWRSYAEALKRGDSLDASIDTANAERTPPKPDLRKTNIPLGPVAVFGASNFPFAFSTAGGDTASAFAAGCPVVVKGHPGHPKTSTMMAQAIARGVAKSGFPKGMFSHVLSNSYEAGQWLVTHPVIKAVGFTGSYQGGMALVELGNNRPDPIPVFAEMGSINPVFLLEEKLKLSGAELATAYVGSLTLGVGQFCTNPGLLVAVDGPELDAFIESLTTAIEGAAPAMMLHEGIAKNYLHNKELVTSQEGVEILARAAREASEGQGSPTVASVMGTEFLHNEHLQEEVFGPFALVVKCKDAQEMEQVAARLKGQLTCTLLGTEADLTQYARLIAQVQIKCGRILFNNFPTGVEVVKSMHHGGPFPAASDGRFTSVGADAIKRFTRPFSYQNWPDALLPDELKNANPLGIYRMVDNVRSTAPIA
ncbi:NADP-dependent aldehyde dehydrogenase [Dyadobacter jejuensis]|uniref:NADP-dependent aldehyde dehydrogenase n=2 Tax=Dyadobacter jejuensis TaxID=1082580 RepID=A0A316AR59_9BACT|nr:NADP-dependent aldehyde dehydrogenase [Dyadobacter jejuensis]